MRPPSPCWSGRLWPTRARAYGPPWRWRAAVLRPRPQRRRGSRGCTLSSGSSPPSGEGRWSSGSMRWDAGPWRGLWRGGRGAGCGRPHRRVNDSKQVRRRTARPSQAKCAGAPGVDGAVRGAGRHRPGGHDGGPARAFAAAIAEVEAQGVAVDVVLLDGNPLHLDPREVNVVKGDGKCASIAAASLVAKVARDHVMEAYAEQYPATASNRTRDTAPRAIWRPSVSGGFVPSTGAASAPSPPGEPVLGFCDASATLLRRCCDAVATPVRLARGTKRDIPRHFYGRARLRCAPSRGKERTLWLRAVRRACWSVRD